MSNRESRSFDVNVAKKIGLSQAIVLAQVNFWVIHNRQNCLNYYDGRYWTYNSFNSWQEQFPFWSVRTIKSIFKSLKESGLLLTGNFNKFGFDRTMWYTVDYEKYTNLFGFADLERIESPEEPTIGFTDYHQYIKSDAWASIRLKRMKLDGFQCCVCGTAKNLVVHHITYERLGHEHMDDLLTVCKKCHEEIHKNDLKR